MAKTFIWERTEFWVLEILAPGEVLNYVAANRRRTMAKDVEYCIAYSPKLDQIALFYVSETRSGKTLWEPSYQNPLSFFFS